MRLLHAEETMSVTCWRKKAIGGWCQGWHSTQARSEFEAPDE